MGRRGSHSIDDVLPDVVVGDRLDIARNTREALDVKHVSKPREPR
ncbi:hypothetical protein BFL35_06985 [Clavibacter michiganensis]|nr:hypothetical protein BFL35_06985 [Clavibacter michiganensis]